MHDGATVRRVEELVQLGLPIAEIARRAGVSRSTVRAWREVRFERPQRGHRREEPCPLVEAVPARDYAYLLGQYLGDGDIARMPNGVFRLQITCCDDYPGIRDECAAALRAVIPGNQVGFYASEGCTRVAMYSLHWPCLSPQHGPGKKHERPIALAAWQEAIALDQHPAEFVRGLTHSDGSRFVNRVVRQLVRGPKTYEYTRYMFSNQSADIRDLFQAACFRLGIDSRPNNWNSISVARREAVALLDSYVGPKY